MNFKKYIKNPSFIIKYFKMKRLHGKYGRKLDDITYLKKVYKLEMGKELNLDNPQTFNEKLQWLKLYDRRPEYTQMVDKYEAKKHIGAKIGSEYLINTLGVWNKFDDIDFDKLPNKFVLKTTHDSGGVVICKDKNNFDFKTTKKKLEWFLNREYFYAWREWPYKDVKPRIIAEQFMEQENGQGLTDYKFYCFNGEPKFLYLSEGLTNHATAHLQYVSLNWEKMAVRRADFPEIGELPKKPATFDKMIEFAKVLSQDIPFLRVDFYEINKKLYIGELTFSPGAGFTVYEPREWDYKFGSWIKLPIDNKKE